jgi:hypothetical protein
VEKPKFRFKKKKIKRVNRKNKESSSKEISNIKSDSSDNIQKTENGENTPNISQVKVDSNSFKNDFLQNQPISYNEKTSTNQIEQSTVKRKKKKRKKHTEDDQTRDEAREVRYQLPSTEAPKAAQEPTPIFVPEFNTSVYLEQPVEAPQLAVIEKSTERKKRKAMYPSVERPKGGDSVERPPAYSNVEKKLVESVERKKPRT